MHWSKAGAGQQPFMQDRYECLRQAQQEKFVAWDAIGGNLSGVAFGIVSGVAFGIVSAVAFFAIWSAFYVASPDEGAGILPYLLAWEGTFLFFILGVAITEIVKGELEWRRWRSNEVK